MSAILTQRPAAFCPVNNPVVYKFQRQELFFDTVGNGGPYGSAGDLYITAPGFDYTGDIIVGDVLYVETEDGVYHGYYTVTDITLDGGTDTYITFTGGYTLPSGAGFLIINPLTTKLLYRLVVEVWDSSLSTLLGTLSRSPDSRWKMMFDVSAYIKTILYRDWDSSVTNEDHIGSVEFYIKYREVWVGSAESQTSDSASPRIAVMASLQIRSNADMDAYVPEGTTKKFLTKFDKPSLWRGYPFSISFLRPDDLSDLVFYYTETDQYGNILASKVTDVSGSDDALFRAFISNINANTKKIFANLSDGVEFTADASSWTDGANPFGSKSGSEFTKNNAVGGTTYSAYQSVDILNGETPSDIAAILSWAKNNPVSGTTFDAYIKFYDAPGGTLLGTSHAGPYNASLSFFPFVFTFSPLTGDATIMELSFVVFGGSLDDVTIQIQPNQLIYASGASAVSETKEITVKDPCDNPVYLFWKNTLGGDAFWLFDGSQDFGFIYDNEKAKRLTVFAEDISINEWEALNELNTIGSLFKTNIEELTTSVNKTKERSDQQVYVIDASGNTIGVVNITNELTTATQQVKHMFMTTIEYPEIFLG